MRNVFNEICSFIKTGRNIRPVVAFVLCIMAVGVLGYVGVMIVSWL